MNSSKLPSPEQVNDRVRVDDEQLIGSVVGALDHEVDVLDAATCSRLRIARRTALDKGRQRVTPVRPFFATPALGGLFAAIAFTVLVWALRPSGAPLVLPVASLSPSPEDLPVLLAGDDLDFYRSVDFLLWLETHDEQG